jgi:hypothetical protein
MKNPIKFAVPHAELFVAEIGKAAISRLINFRRLFNDECSKRCVINSRAFVAGQQVADSSPYRDELRLFGRVENLDKIRERHAPTEPGHQCEQVQGIAIRQQLVPNYLIVFLDGS